MANHRVPLHTVIIALLFTPSCFQHGLLTRRIHTQTLSFSAQFNPLWCRSLTHRLVPAQTVVCRLVEMQNESSRAAQTATDRSVKMVIKGFMLLRSESGGRPADLRFGNCLFNGLSKLSVICKRSFANNSLKL